MKVGKKHMKVFISWSGDISLKVALIFREWLPSVIQSIEPYVSSEDIDKGARWSTDIAKELENSNFGILCVTKENLEAPWLSFEAGALSKTIEKSYVTPFLFDIKRSEVQGPILQFQSTIFEKEDIKKMVKTLNKACGEAGMPENRLDKCFDVWYTHLEMSLNELRKNNIENNTKEKNVKEPNSNASDSDILEEILELTRDNQKLLRNPDTKLYEDIGKVKDTLELINVRNSSMYEEKRMAKKYSSRFFDEIIHTNFGSPSYGFVITLSLIREEFPWIYDMGRELLDILKSGKKVSEKQKALREFKDMLEFTSGHPLMRETFARNKNTMYLMNELPYTLYRYIDEISNEYLK